MIKINLQTLRNPKVIYAAVIVLLISSITFYVLKEKEKALRINIQKQLVKTVEEKEVVEIKLLDTLQAKEKTEKELVSEKEKSLVLKKEVAEKDSQIKDTLDRLEREIAARRQVEAELMVVMKEKETLEAKVKKFTRAPKTVALEKIVVKPTSRLAGKVVMVNKEYDFIVVNLGSRDNLKLGEVLSVYRNDEFIGKAQVESLRDKMSAAAILPGWQNVEFKENDIIKII